MGISLKVENAILERVKKITGKNSDKELAELLGLKQGNFSARKQRGSLTPVISEWAIQTKIDLNWLLRGESSRKDVSDNFLQKVEEWTEELLQEDNRSATWFEYEFEKKFPDFKKWKEEKEESETAKTYTSNRKVA